MGGGLMQLVAYGAQDVYLSGTPQITFWKVVYRRHTNFSIETIEQSIDAARPGGKYTVTVTRNGDLAANACLKVKLTAITSASFGTAPTNVAWVRRLGHAMVSQVKVEIGGSTIDTHVSTWLDLWYELTHKTDQERGYRAMIGDVEELTKLRPIGSGINAYTVYVPFQFWFCRNTGLALPLIALQYHEVRFHIEMESIQKLMIWSGTTPAMNSYTYQSAAVMVDYVYLDSEERRKFAQVGHEYLIEEVQHNGGETLSGTVSSLGASLTSKFRLNFNHPCKELVWALKCGAFSGEALTNSFGGGKTFLGYTHDDDKWEDVLERVAKGLAEKCVKIGTADDYSAASGEFADNATAGTSQVLRTGKFTVSSFLTGTITNPATVFVRTSGVLLGDAAETVNLFHNIINADLTVTIPAGATAAQLPTVTCTRIVHTLTMELLSIPAAQWTVDGRQTTGIYTNADAVVNVVQPHNYGLNLDGSGNVVSEGKIELNGHDRFDWQEGSYFNYVQPRAHTRTPADGVNVYCFGLHPENHQPSGSANLSRIDTTILHLTLKDSKRPASTTNVLLNWVSDSKLHIFALNYNVLRVMSGMAGKAYSN
jgi:hypothetical protein